MHTLFLSTTVCAWLADSRGDWDGLSIFVLCCLLASAFCVWKCWRTLVTGKALSRQKWKKNKAVSSMVFRTWNAPSEGIIFSFHRLHWHVLTGGNLMPFGSIWPFYIILPHSIIPSMSRIQCRRWLVLHLTDVSHLVSQDWLQVRSQTHESMNRSRVTSNFSEDVAALAAPGSKEGKTMENMETCWGRCVFFYANTANMIKRWRCCRKKPRRRERRRPEWIRQVQVLMGELRCHE